MHPHDLAQFTDRDGIAIRAGHLCAQPLMKRLGVPAVSRASVYFYNLEEELDRLAQSILKAKEFFRHGS
ncbi:MAG: aminotransferase class V-fold PLP-dependent enzyme [Verrucomicrobia bacterium]|nr:aminotransferase class V-fold PLP-dependent enzyme [Verrucomicrobiota bacterium]